MPCILKYWTSRMKSLLEFGSLTLPRGDACHIVELQGSSVGLKCSGNNSWSAWAPGRCVVAAKVCGVSVDDLQKASSVTLTTPNLLTLIRIGTVPILVILLLFPGPAPSAGAAAVFFAATVTDFLDGYIARNYGSGSTVGKFLDPLADKLVVTAALIMLAGMPRIPRVPAWMVVVFVSREILVTGLRAVAAAEGRVIAAAELGKYKMVLQAIGLQGLLIHYPYFNIDFFAAGLFILWIALVLSVWSGLEYFLEGFRLLTARERTQRIKRAAM
jgi:CDP-diacylglycerol---glycerol-3-phosphate 3-phosphatidyltransferase